MKSGPLMPTWTMDMDPLQIRPFADQFAEAAIAAKPPPEERSWVEQDHAVATRDGATITIRTHTPRDPSPSGGPGMILFHGGAFFMGNLEMNNDIARVINAMGGVAVDVGYRLAPEHPFPTAILDGVDAMKWVS
jgi:acetyl esterase/lipase